MSPHTDPILTSDPTLIFSEYETVTESKTGPLLKFQTLTDADQEAEKPDKDFYVNRAAVSPLPAPFFVARLIFSLFTCFHKSLSVEVPPAPRGDQTAGGVPQENPEQALDFRGEGHDHPERPMRGPRVSSSTRALVSFSLCRFPPSFGLPHSLPFTLSRLLQGGFLFFRCPRTCRPKVRAIHK